MASGLKSIRGFKGFLLLELIVSIVMISGGLLFVSLSFHTSKKVVLNSRELFRQSLLLQEKMVNLQLEEKPQKATDSGSFEENPEYSWRLDSKKDEEFNKLEHVTLSIIKSSRPETESSIQTYLKAVEK